MSNNRIPLDLVSIAGTVQREAAAPRVSLTARLGARLRADKYDRMLAVGVQATPGSALQAHERRLTSTAERETLARALRAAVADSRDGAPLSSRVPLNVPNISAAADVIDAITLRLHAPRPVSARGMARLRLILGDGSGPLYRYGRGDLAGRLGAALAALY